MFMNFPLLRKVVSYIIQECGFMNNISVKSNVLHKKFKLKKNPEILMKENVFFLEIILCTYLNI